MVRRRHLHPPNTGLGANVGVKRTTSKLLVLVELLNLTFDLELDVGRDSNVKSAPLGKSSLSARSFRYKRQPVSAPGGRSTHLAPPRRSGDGREP
ncbi:hypothetical protein CHELA40_14617 [Chelatococcus asaccharovorans]|nr:hypothetical protein CHELA17_61003 [Chelatococcus asaccharovorans]CAH1678784.1 hypothetical protein CHELA40_14617 [Chelatococcus asaccharovorans]